MNICDMENLFVGSNENAHFNVLICAADTRTAEEIAEEYRTDMNLEGEFQVKEFTNATMKIDCNYILS